ncbi:MAG: FG-GAP-like repeat-containing protein [Pyrinomonadaceae bacterium]
MGYDITKLFILGAFLFLGMATDIRAAGGYLDTGFNGIGKSVFNIEDAPAPGSFADVAVIAGNKFLMTGRIVAGEYYNVILSRFNADGSLDISFGSGGRVITDTGIVSEGKALAVQPDGKIVVVASAGSQPYQAVVIRYTADGTLDTSFGNNGIFFSALQGPQDIEIAADNKIYIAGNSLFVPPNPGIQLARINADGTADTSFGNNGVVLAGIHGDTDQIALQPDGKIVVSARSWRDPSSAWIFRFNTDGSIDSGFGTGGIRELIISNSGSIFMGGGVAVQPDGKIVLAGYARTNGMGFGNSGLMLARLNPDGSTDASFSGGNIVIHDLSATMDRATDIALQGDGKILVSGTRADSTAIAARFDSTGALDATFGKGGVVLLPPARNATALAVQGSDIVVVGDDYSDVYVLARLASTGTILSYTNQSFIVGKNDYALDAAIQSDGKIVTAGFSTSPAGITVIAVARLLSNGNLDSAFGTGGRVVFNEGNTYSTAYAVKIQPDGKILVGGKFSNFSSEFPSLYVIRLDADGSLDTTFGTGGKVRILPAFGGLIGYDVELQPDGKIVVGGAYMRPGNEGVATLDMMAARLNPNGTADGGFGNGGVFIHTNGDGWPPYLFEYANALSILPDGKIILAGSHLLRLASNGTIDAGFPLLAPVDFPATDITLQPDGKMLLSGSKNTDLAIARYNSNASIDTNFGVNGIAFLDFGGADNANALYLDPNGDIVAGGSTLGGNPSRRKFALARFKSDGSPDSSFGNGGKVITDFGGDAEIFGIARQSDGNIVAAGSAKINIDRDFALARYFSRAAPFDFDGDAKTDISIFRPSNGQWWYLKSSDGGNAAFQFGNSSDKMAPADFTGDGKTDVAIWRPSTGEWFILRSEDFSYYSFPFGINGDIPAPADFDADGKTDAAVFRPSNSTWYINKSTGGTIIEQFGISGDVPVVADYDADGKSDIAIWRASAGQWWIQRSTLGTIAYTFGNSADKPVQGDYTGDGKADVAIWRPSTGEWFILRSEDASYYSVPFGMNGDIPSAGDFDGDGKFDYTVFRPTGSTWYVQRTTAGTLIQNFGQNGDIPVPNAFVP